MKGATRGAPDNKSLNETTLQYCVSTMLDVWRSYVVNIASEKRTRLWFVTRTIVLCYRTIVERSTVVLFLWTTLWLEIMLELGKALLIHCLWILEHGKSGVW